VIGGARLLVKGKNGGKREGLSPRQQTPTSAFVSSPTTRWLLLKTKVFTSTKVLYQDGWWRFEYEEVVAPAPAEESGAGLAGGEESCEYLSL
jgi:hypothetical protein